MVLRLRSPLSLRAGALIAITGATLATPSIQLAAQPLDDTDRFPPRSSIDGFSETTPRPTPPGLPNFGYRSGRGAGTTGFDSTNAARRKGKNAPKAASAGGKNRGAKAQIPVGQPLSLTPSGLLPQSAGPGRRDQALRAAASPAIYTTPVTSDAVLVAPLPPPLHRILRVEDDPFAPLGINTGSFLLRPAVELTGGYDSNAERSTPKVPSWYGVVAPELLINSNWSRHELNASLRGSYLAYERTTELDRPNFEGRVNGRADVSATTRFAFATRFLLSTDNPGSPNIQAGLSRLPIYTTIGGTAGVSQRFNRLDILASADVERTVYEESHFTDGSTASNADRNYVRYGGALRASYEITPGAKPFVEVAGDSRTYDLAVDASGVNRDSEGLSAKAGTTFEYSQKLIGELSVGYLTRHYRDPALESFGGFLLDGALIWNASALTAFKLLATTTAAETTVPGVSAVFTRGVGAQVNHAFRRWLIATGTFGFWLDDYVGSTRVDKRYAASALLTYKATREFWLKAEYRHEWRTSNVPDNDFAADVVLLGVRLQR